MRKKILTFSFFIISLFCAISLIASDCYESSIMSPTPFMGNNKEIFKLADGTIWEVKTEYEYLYEYYPTVMICPEKGILIINGKQLNVEFISQEKSSKSKKTHDWEIAEETHLDGTISGVVKKGSLFKTISGNIYEVTGITIQVVVEVMPEVLVLNKGNKYKLIVDGFDEPLICKCLSKSYNNKSKNGKTLIQSKIINEFDGFKSGNIYKLENGQIWEQTETWIWYWTLINPEVIIWNNGEKYKMKIEQIDHAVNVRRIK